MEEKVVSAGNETGFVPGYAEDTDVLRHLLEIEAEAAALVDSAQAEADRRLKECEEQNRARYHEEYRHLVDSLEKEYKQKLEAARAEYRAGLDEYRKSLDAMPVDPSAFSRLAAELLFGGK
jgi:regulator of protease activity HflC (stomatin/prohibitin superfamily)